MNFRQILIIRYENDGAYRNPSKFAAKTTNTCGEHMLNHQLAAVQIVDLEKC